MGSKVDLSNMYPWVEKLTQICMPGWAVMSLHGEELAETVIWTPVDYEVDWDQKSPGRESETRSDRRAIKALPPLLEHALNVNPGMTGDLGCTAVNPWAKTAKCEQVCWGECTRSFIQSVKYFGDKAFFLFVVHALELTRRSYIFNEYGNQDYVNCGHIWN